MNKLLPGIVLATFATVAVAQVSPTPSQPPKAPESGQAHPDAGKATMSFQSLDKNADQKISKTEAIADQALNESFGSLDANRDGALTMTEYAMHKPRS